MLWREENAGEGTDTVNWNTVCHAKLLGGLDILNIEIMNTAFKVRCSWNLRAEEKKPLCSLSTPVDEKHGPPCDARWLLGCLLVAESGPRIT
jgi:hypothetical protein